MMPQLPCERRPRGYRKSGLYRLKTAVKVLGSRAVDRRTKTGKALAAWRADLASDLGGADELSTQQRALLDEAVKLKLMLDSVDAWVLAQPSLVDKRKRSLLPVVRERLSLVSQLQSLLRDLGLERKARDVTDLQTYLATRTPEDRQAARSPDATPGSASAPDSEMPPARAASVQEPRADVDAGPPIPGEGKANEGAW